MDVNNYLYIIEFTLRAKSPNHIEHNSAQTHFITGYHSVSGDLMRLHVNRYIGILQIYKVSSLNIVTICYPTKLDIFSVRLSQINL